MTIPSETVMLLRKALKQALDIAEGPSSGNVEFLDERRRQLDECYAALATPPEPKGDRVDRLDRVALASQMTRPFSASLEWDRANAKHFLAMLDAALPAAPETDNLIPSPPPNETR